MRSAVLLMLGASIAIVANAGGVEASATVRLVPSRSLSATTTAEATPREIQNDRLAILMQERSAIVAALATESAAASKAEGKANAERRVERLRGDLHAIDAEIARVAKEPPAPIRTPSFSAQPARPESAARAAGGTTPASDAIAYPGWDVFKNFGKQGTTP